MADQLRLRGGDQAASDNFTGVEREVTVDTTEPNLRVHDGKTPGGHKVLMAGSCLVVDKDPCKVTVNGDFEVGGDTTLQDTIIDGNLVVNGNFVQDGLTIAVDTSEVKLSTPGNWYNPGGGCNVLPDSGNMLTQEDANQYISRALAELEGAICAFDLTAIDEIQDIKDELDKVLLAIVALENRLDLVEADIVAIKARLDLIDQAIALMETEIEANQNNITENAKAIEALKVLVADLTKGLSDLEDVVSKLKLNDLADCAVPAPSAGQYLIYRGGQWVAETVPVVQSNWTETEATEPDYIWNKPDVYTKTEANGLYLPLDISTLPALV